MSNSAASASHRAGSSPARACGANAAIVEPLHEPRHDQHLDVGRLPSRRRMTGRHPQQHAELAMLAAEPSRSSRAYAPAVDVIERDLPPCAEATAARRPSTLHAPERPELHTPTLSGSTCWS
jgi:hypothetical protein